MYTLSSTLFTFDSSYTCRVFSLVDEGVDVHSQSRRMIMVSPEPDFWIHAVSITIETVGKAIKKNIDEADA